MTTQEVASPSPSASSWMNAYVVLGCCFLLAVAVHWTTVASIVQTWSRDPFAHGYFVVTAAAYLAWTRRERVASTNPRPAFIALPVLGLLSFLWVLGTLVSATLVQQVSVVTMFLAVAWAVLGSAALRALIFPLGLLVFAVPLGERLAPALQAFTARAALTLLTLSGVHPVLADHRISIAETTWHVTQACGGINYLVASLAVGYVYAGTVYRQWGHRCAFMAASALVPLAANAVRVYATILLDHLGATRVAAGMLHYLFGVLVFGVMMAVLFVTCGHWREEPVTGEDPTLLPRRVAPVVSPRRVVLCATCAMLLIMMGPVFVAGLGRPRRPEGTIHHNPPAVSAPWKATVLRSPESSLLVCRAFANSVSPSP